MQLRKMLNNLNYQLVQGKLETDIRKIRYDSRKVEEGDLFLCIEGYISDGHDFIKIAIEKGAKTIVCTKDVVINEDVNVIKVRDSREALAIISANFYNNPDKKMKIIGVTGTAGKTSTTFIYREILKSAGIKSGLIGTIRNYIGDEGVMSERTTPESLELFELLSKMVDSGIEYCIMEVSSHSLILKRVFGINFDYGIFTNLSQDHLDYHGTMDAYFKAKKILFENSKVCISNIDDEHGVEIYGEYGGIAFSIDNDSNFRATNIEYTTRSTSFILKKDGEELCEIQINMIGKYNIYNALGAIIVAKLEGISMNDIINGLKTVNVPGRSENVSLKYNLGFEILIDFAHTPDEVEKFLSNVKKFTKGRLITVFGCGGDRDRTKRYKMGKIATDISDYSIVTSDNPRTEDPEKIIRDIIDGIASTQSHYEVECDRKLAIEKAILMGKENDVIAIIGKGHEMYQEIMNKKYEFDEKKIVSEIIEEKLI